MDSINEINSYDILSMSQNKKKEPPHISTSYSTSKINLVPDTVNESLNNNLEQNKKKENSPFKRVSLEIHSDPKNNNINIQNISTKEEFSSSKTLTKVPNISKLVTSSSLKSLKENSNNNHNNNNINSNNNKEGQGQNRISIHYSSNNNSSIYKEYKESLSAKSHSNSNNHITYKILQNNSNSVSNINSNNNTNTNNSINNNFPGNYINNNNTKNYNYNINYNFCKHNNNHHLSSNNNKKYSKGLFNNYNGLIRPADPLLKRTMVPKVNPRFGKMKAYINLPEFRGEEPSIKFEYKQLLKEMVNTPTIDKQYEVNLYVNSVKMINNLIYLKTQLNKEGLITLENFVNVKKLNKSYKNDSEEEDMYKNYQYQENGSINNYNQIKNILENGNSNKELFASGTFDSSIHPNNNNNEGLIFDCAKKIKNNYITNENDNNEANENKNDNKDINLDLELNDELIKAKNLKTVSSNNNDHNNINIENNGNEKDLNKLNNMDNENKENLKKARNNNINNIINNNFIVIEQNNNQASNNIKFNYSDKNNPNIKLNHKSPIRNSNTTSNNNNTKSFFQFSHNRPKTCIHELKPFYTLKNKNDNTLIFESRFESGNLLCAFRTEDENSYQLYLQNDTNTTGYIQWFFFRVSNTKKGRKVNFNIINMLRKSCIYSHGLKIMTYSTIQALRENIGWHRDCDNLIYYPNNLYVFNENSGKRRNLHSLSFDYIFKYDNDTVYFANCLPYFYSSLMKELNTYELNETKYPFFHRKTLATTLGGNDLDMFTINSMYDIYKNGVTNVILPKSKENNNSNLTKNKTNLNLNLNGTTSNIQNSLSKITNNNSNTNNSNNNTNTNNNNNNTSSSTIFDNRKAVIIIARQHPGETVGSYVMKGCMDFLMSDSPEAKKLREVYLFKIVPMMNPDGVLVGNSRTSFAGCDLNRRWSKPSEIIHPEVYHTKQMILKLSTQRNIGFVVDCHGHFGTFNSLFYCNYKDNKRTCTLFPYLCGKLSRIISFQQCSFSMPKYKLSTERISLFNELDDDDNNNIVALETSFFGVNRAGEYARLYYTSKLLKEIGRDLCLGMLSYYYKYENISLSIEPSTKENFKKLDVDMREFESEIIKEVNEDEDENNNLDGEDKDGDNESESEPSVDNLDKNQIMRLMPNGGKKRRRKIKNKTFKKYDKKKNNNDKNRDLDIVLYNPIKEAAKKLIEEERRKKALRTKIIINCNDKKKNMQTNDEENEPILENKYTQTEEIFFKMHWSCFAGQYKILGVKKNGMAVSTTNRNANLGFNNYSGFGNFNNGYNGFNNSINNNNYGNGLFGQLNKTKNQIKNFYESSIVNNNNNPVKGKYFGNNRLLMMGNVNSSYNNNTNNNGAPRGSTSDTNRIQRNLNINRNLHYQNSNKNIKNQNNNNNNPVNNNNDNNKSNINMNKTNTVYNNNSNGGFFNNNENNKENNNNIKEKDNKENFNLTSKNNFKLLRNQENINNNNTNYEHKKNQNLKNNEKKSNIFQNVKIHNGNHSHYPKRFSNNEKNIFQKIYNNDKSQKNYMYSKQNTTEIGGEQKMNLNDKNINNCEKNESKEKDGKNSKDLYKQKMLKKMAKSSSSFYKHKP